MAVSRLVALLVLVLLGLPPTASAQRDQFFDALPAFYSALAGAYGDEGSQLTAHLETLSRALTAWDREVAVTELELRARLKGADKPTALEVHTVLAALYAERGRFREALREIGEDIRIDPKRAAFHRFQALLYQAANRPADAANAFRATWIIEPADPQNAYRLVVNKSARTTVAELDRALTTLANVERELIRGQRDRAESPFLALSSINDDVGGALLFAPSAYARGMSLLLDAQFETGITELRAVIATDPLVADSAARSEPMQLGVAELRKGRVSAAIEHLETATARTPNSSEAHRILGTAHGINGDVANSLRHLRDSVRLNPRDERSWLALAQALDASEELVEAVEVLRKAVAELPDSGALRWMLSVTSGKRQRTDDADLELIATADRLVLLAGRGDLYGRIARLAQGHLDYDRAVNLLEQRVALTPNSAAAHKALGRAYVEQGREDTGYAELVIALMLDTSDAETLTAIGRLHLTAGRYSASVETLTRAVALEPANPQAVHALGDALVRAGRAAEGQQRLEESERLQARAVEQQRRQRTAGMLAVQAELRMRERQYDTAIELWQQVIDLERGRIENHLRLAEAFAGAGRLEQAAVHIQRAISLNAGPEAHLRLAEVWAALGRTEESVRERRTYVEQRLQQLREPSGETGALVK